MIFQQFPQPIRQLYSLVVTERSLPARHAKLCKLGEGALAYMASMALSDYRNRRHTDPDPKAESVLSGLKRISMGQYLQLFRVATDAIQPALFDYKLSRPDNCMAISRFARRTPRSRKLLTCRLRTCAESFSSGLNHRPRAPG